MKTTLRELKEIFGVYSFDKLTSKLNTNDLNTEVSILEILNSNGIADVVWALKTQDYKDYCLFNADVAESVLHIFEEKHPGDKRPRKLIEGIRLFHAGKITSNELEILRMDAGAYVNNNYTSAFDTSAVSVYWTSYYAAYYNHNDVNAVYNSAYYATSASVYYAADTTTAAREKKWKEIEVMLRKFLKVNLLDDSLFVI